MLRPVCIQNLGWEAGLVLASLRVSAEEDTFRGEEEIVLTALQRKPEAGTPMRWLEHM